MYATKEWGSYWELGSSQAEEGGSGVRTNKQNVHFSNYSYSLLLLPTPIGGKEGWGLHSAPRILRACLLALSKWPRYCSLGVSLFLSVPCTLLVVTLALSVGVLARQKAVVLACAQREGSTH